MRKFRKTAVITAIAAAMLFPAGCRWPHAARTQQEIISDAADYLTGKYGFISYTVEGFVSGGGLLGTSYDTINYSDTYQDVSVGFYVHVYEDENPVRYEDSYFGLTVIDDFEQLAGKEAARYFPGCKLYATDIAYAAPDSSLDKNSSFADWLALDRMLTKDIPYPYYILVSEETMDKAAFEEAAAGMLADWQQVDSQTRPYIIYLTADQYSQCSRINCQNFHTLSNCIESYGETLKPEGTITPEPLSEQQLAICRQEGYPVNRAYMTTAQIQAMEGIDAMLTYLKNKYGISFCYEYYSSTYHGQSMFAYPEGGDPEDVFSVSCGILNDDFEDSFPSSAAFDEYSREHLQLSTEKAE